MSQPDALDDAIAALLDRSLLGESVDLSALLAEYSGLDEGQRARLSELAATFSIHEQEKPPRERLGPYRLLEPLGRGAMGVVWLAEQEPLARQVALKLIRPEYADAPLARDRFLREAQAAAALRHDHIVSVLAAGEDDGIAWIAMDLVPGRGMDELLRSWAARTEPRLEIERIVEWGRDLARALHCAHEAGVIHRDVKPSNVRITPDGRALLLDFGLARNVHSLSVTQSGEFRGSPYYASPEQVNARANGIDGRSDVYSLGITLYECLAGRVPFEGETREQVFHQILSREPVALRRLNTGVSRDVETVVLKAMEKEPTRRYPTAAAFAADLDAVLSMRPVVARPVGVWGRTWKWIRRRPSSAAAIVLGIALVVGLPLSIAIVQTKALREVQQERDIADGIRLATQSTLILPEDPSMALLLAVESAKRNPGVLANNALFAALEALHEVQTLIGHEGPTRVVRWTSDQERLVSGGEDGSVRIWRAADGQELNRLQHPESVTYVALHPDGRRVATSCADGFVRLWSLEDGSIEVALEASPDRIGRVGFDVSGRRLAFESSGRRLAFGGADGTVRIWDLETREVWRQFDCGSRRVKEVHFSGDDAELLAASYDGTALIWNVEQGVERLRLGGDGGELRYARFAKDGRHVLTAAYGGSASVWRAEDGELVWELPQLNETGPVCFVGDGDRLLSASPTGKLDLWDLSTRQSLQSWNLAPDVRSILPSEDSAAICSESGPAWILDYASGEIACALLGHQRQVQAAVPSADGRYWATASEDGIVRIWDRKPPRLVRDREIVEGTTHVTWSEDGSKLAVGLVTGGAVVLGSESLETLVELANPGAQPTFLRFSKDGSLLAGSSWDVRQHRGRLEVWDVAAGASLWHVATRYTGRFQFHPNRACLASYEPGGRIEVHDLQTGDLLGHFGQEEEPMRMAQLSPGPPQAACIMEDGRVVIYDWSQQRVLAELPAPESRYLDLAFRADGQALASLQEDGTIALLSLPEGKRLAHNRLPAGNARRILFHHSGEPLVFKMQRADAWLWNPSRDEAPLLLSSHGQLLSNLSFGGAGNRLVSGGADGVVRVMDSRTGEEQLVIEGFPSSVFYAALDPSGTRVAVAHKFGVAVVELVNLLATARERVPRALTEVERERFRLSE